VTKQEFTERYARKSGFTVQQLLAAGLRAVPCQPDCDYEKCKGWRMIGTEGLLSLAAAAPNTICRADCGSCFDDRDVPPCYTDEIGDAP